MDKEKHNTTLIYACNGVSAQGRLTNEAANELENRGIGKKACLAGVGAGIDFKVKDSKDAARRVTLDGCKLCCAKRILEKAGITDSLSIVTIDSGIKTKSDQPTEEETMAFSDYVENQLKGCF
jgi:uncharacterized metal-binding protein